METPVLFRGEVVLRVHVQCIPADFTPFYRNYPWDDFVAFVDWILKHGHWQDIIIEQWGRNGLPRRGTFGIAVRQETFAFWTPEQWLIMKDWDYENMRSHLTVQCYMGPSALMHYQLSFND